MKKIVKKLQNIINNGLSNGYLNIDKKFIGDLSNINDDNVVIIDYKTGNPNLDLTTVPYGIGMQLPIYLYLSSKMKLKNIVMN